MRRGRMPDADATSQQHRHLQSPAAHVLHLGDLIDDLADRIQHEVGKHEVDHRPSPRHRSSAGQPDKTTFADRSIAESNRTELFKQPRRRLEVTATNADPLTHHEDAWVLRHLLRECFVSCLRISDLTRFGRCGWSKVSNLTSRWRGLFAVDVSRRVFRFRPSTRLRELTRLIDHRFHFRIDRIEFRSGRGLVGDQLLPQASDRAFLLPGIDVLARAIREVSHPFRVSPRPIGFAFDKSRPASSSRTCDSFARYFVNRQSVVAVEFKAGQTIRRTAIADARIAARISERNFGRELIVLANEQHRQLPDRRHVQPFVERAVVDRSVTEERNRHTPGLHQLRTVSATARLQDARPHDAAGPHHADLR